MGACVDREPGERPSTTGHRGPAAGGGKVGAAERRAEAVVDHLLRAHPLTSGQASVAERRGGAADEDRGRHVLGSAPTSCFWAGEGGRIHSAAACSGGSLSALTHDATTPAITPFPRAMACTLASPCCVLKRDGLSAVGGHDRPLTLARRNLAS
jgi:hypothetical protein